MRIITGSAKGTKLKAPRGLDTRPTTDRVKESIFNILGNAVYEAMVLDLFAGTGSLGLEALSRGAQRAVFVDQNTSSIHVIKENVDHTKMSDKAEILKSDVLKTIEKFTKTKDLFDIVFCDPPYNKGYINKVLQLIDQGAIVAEQAILVLEHSRHEQLANQWDNLVLKRSERYGETIVSFLIYNSQQTKKPED
ncbi:16S rRNA (guanine(966)-N(2))-methyltransferase RsmD [bacterium BFN5]|nr:16S rRNA (guanine(966)-N(2))-methyltransferase RsmD [bacterium BFN5]QJW44449.1 16S rRNA (guanine(966)-N(2))-methyltransferase RsmD [bacterium BFN5]